MAPAYLSKRPSAGLGADPPARSSCLHLLQPTVTLHSQPFFAASQPSVPSAPTFGCPHHPGLVHAPLLRDAFPGAHAQPPDTHSVQGPTQAGFVHNHGWSFRPALTLESQI